MIQFKKVHALAKIPKRQKEGDAGFDISSIKRYEVPPGKQLIADTGIACAIPPLWVGQIWPRSGFATKNVSDVHAGIIDSNYRGEIKVALINHGPETIEIMPGDRIGQLVVTPCMTDSIEVKELDDTERGECGFGSTGA